MKDSHRALVRSSRAGSDKAIPVLDDVSDFKNQCLGDRLREARIIADHLLHADTSDAIGDITMMRRYFLIAGFPSEMATK
jgi:hypothetical protein